jgi:copper chaperone CopZ
MLTAQVNYNYPIELKTRYIMQKIMLDIAGMRCGACAVGIELMLGKKKGIKSAKVSLNERMAVVEYDPVSVTASEIGKAVNDLGYIATVRS